MTTGVPLHEQVVRHVGERIVSGEFAPGAALRTEHLGAALGVSRSVVREAVRVLESMRVVEVRRRVGITVLPARNWSAFEPRIVQWRLAGPGRADQLRALGELRTAIEPMAARLAAARATPKQCGALTGAVIGMSATARAANADTYLAHDIAFHRTLLAASGNDLLGGCADFVAELLTGRTRHDLMPQTANPDAVRLHGEVAAAVQAADAPAAERAMRDIVEEAIAALPV